jgi:predicted amidohydrolase
MLAHTQPTRTVVAESHPPHTPHMRDAALEQACERIVDAGLAGARWAIFPEGYIPGYPLWVWRVSPGDHPLLSVLRAEAMANMVQVPSAVTDRLCTVAQRAQVNVVIGVIERADDEEATCYSTLLFIDTQGRLVGRYRTACVGAATSPKWIPAAIGRPTDETPTRSGVGGI